MKAIRCTYCDQLHPATRADRLDRLGRLYYGVTCPSTQGLNIVPAEQLVALP